MRRLRISLFLLLLFPVFAANAQIASTNQDKSRLPGLTGEDINSYDNLAVAMDEFDPAIINTLDGPAPENLTAVQFSLSNVPIFYDSTYTGKLFGFVPKEFIISDSQKGGNHLQINYQFQKNPENKNGYAPTLKIVDQLTRKYGKPEVSWWNNQMQFIWPQLDWALSISHIELSEMPIVIVRIDIEDLPKAQ